MEGTAFKIVKYLIFAFNLLFFVLGLILIAGGSVLQAAYKDYFAFFGNDVNSTAIFVIIIGIICTILAFFGCCGAIKENHFMLITFSVALSIVLVLEIAAAVAAFVLKAQVKDLIRDNMKRTIPQYHHHGVHDAWDHMQRSLQCCGAESYKDWKLNKKFEEKRTLPDSCCIKNNTISGCAGRVLSSIEATHAELANVYHKGCAEKLIEFTQKNIASIGAISVAWAIIQAVGVVLACMLAHSLRQQKYQQM